MLGLTIFLLTVNIFLTIFVFFKLSARFSNVNIIADIRKDAERLVTDIAYQTEKAVTVIEDAIKEAVRTREELEKIIILAQKETEKKDRQEELLQGLTPENSNKEKPKTRSTKKAKKDAPPKNEVESQKKPPAQKKSLVQSEPLVQTEPLVQNELAFQNDALAQRVSEPIQIYTKQILQSPNRKYTPVEASFNEQIIEMAKKGFSTELIAEKVPLPIGEIELIISMNS